MALLLVLLGVLLVGYLLLCLFYWVFQERFIFIRFRVGMNYRWRFQFPYEERFLTATDGARLHGLYFPAEEPRGVILYFHGNTGSLRRWGRLAPRFTKLGYDVLMPDYRGYGRSRGRLSEAALLSDAEAWYASLLERWQERDIIIYGRSLGSAMATPLSAIHAPRMLLLETPFANLQDVAMSYLPILPYRVLLRYPFRNDKAIRRVRCPVYIFHGQRDTMVPYNSALRLYALIPADVPREMITFPKGHHGDLARFRKYEKTLRRLLAPGPDRAVPAPPSRSA